MAKRKIAEKLGSKITELPPPVLRRVVEQDKAADHELGKGAGHPTALRPMSDKGMAETSDGSLFGMFFGTTPGREAISMHKDTLRRLGRPCLVQKNIRRSSCSSVYETVGLTCSAMGLVSQSLVNCALLFFAAHSPSSLASSSLKPLLKAD